MSKFESTESFNTVTFRKNKWSYNYNMYKSYEKDHLRVNAEHNKGNEPYSSVRITHYVLGRQSDEAWDLNKDDVVAMRDMFAQIASKMKDVSKEEE